MKVKIILFPRGAGGNFLARVLTLDPATVPLGSENYSTAYQRCQQYCYTNIATPFNQQLSNGLSSWVDTELNHFYFPLTRGFEELISLDQIIVEPIHPDHYAQKINLFGESDEIDLYYLDITGCKEWVQDQVAHKISNTADNTTETELESLNTIIQNLSPTSISLLQILKSESTFCDEYIKLCNAMKLNSYPELALTIYQSWKNTWKQNDK